MFSKMQVFMRIARLCLVNLLKLHIFQVFHSFRVPAGLEFGFGFCRVSEMVKDRVSFGFGFEKIAKTRRVFGFG